MMDMGTRALIGPQSSYGNDATGLAWVKISSDGAKVVNVAPWPK